MADIRHILGVARNRSFENQLDYLCPGEIWRIMRNIERGMDAHTSTCQWCIDVGCEEFNSMLIKHTAARHRLGIN